MRKEGDSEGEEDEEREEGWQCGGGGDGGGGPTSTLDTSYNFFSVFARTFIFSFEKKILTNPLSIQFNMPTIKLEMQDSQ